MITYPITSVKIESSSNKTSTLSPTKKNVPPKKVANIATKEMVDKTGKSSKDSSWEEPTKEAHQQPVTRQQKQTPLSRLAVSLSSTTREASSQQEIPAFQETTQSEPATNEEPPAKIIPREVSALKGERYQHPWKQ